MKKLSLLALATISCGLLQAQPPDDAIIRVTLLGTGVPLLNTAAYVKSGRVTAGLMIEAGGERMLFDCGQGVLNRLLQSGGPADNPNAAIDKLFISHLHSDHIGDLASLYSYGWLYRYDVPLRVWGPSGGINQPVGTKQLMQLLRLAYDTDFYVRSTLFSILSFPLTGVEPDGNTWELVPDGVAYSNNGVTVTSFLVDHHPVGPAFGFKIEYQGKAVVFSGDTTYTDNMVKYGKGADLVINEAWGYDPDTELYPYHCPPEGCLNKIFTGAAPKMAVLTHIATPPGTTVQDLVARIRAAGYTGPLTAGLDLMTIDVTASGIRVTPPAANATEQSPESRGSLPAEVRSLRKTN